MKYALPRFRVVPIKARHQLAECSYSSYSHHTLVPRGVITDNSPCSTNADFSPCSPRPMHQKMTHTVAKGIGYSPQHWPVAAWWGSPKGMFQRKSTGRVVTRRYHTSERDTTSTASPP